MRWLYNGRPGPPPIDLYDPIVCIRQSDHVAQELTKPLRVVLGDYPRNDSFHPLAPP